MESSVRDLLAQRQRRKTGRRVGSVLLSLAVHAAGFGTLLLAPALAAREAEPLQYTRVQIVPLRALGVRDPEPVRRSEPPAAPEPKPAAPEPEPEPPAARTPAPSEERRRPPAATAAPAGPAPSRSTDGGEDRPAQRRGTPDGSPLGLAPFGSSESGFDDPDFQYGYYTDMLLAIIGSNWVRPAIGTEVELVVHFRVARDGTIYDVEITKPSGYASFDQAGLSAVRSSTLPNLPISYPHDSLGVSLIIR